jgi:hypothetical protein
MARDALTSAIVVQRLIRRLSERSDTWLCRRALRKARLVWDLDSMGEVGCGEVRMLAQLRLDQARIPTELRPPQTAREELHAAGSIEPTVHHVRRSISAQGVLSGIGLPADAGHLQVVPFGWASHSPVPTALAIDDVTRQHSSGADSSPEP